MSPRHDDAEHAQAAHPDAAEPTVSVLLTVYHGNTASQLGQALDSLRRQTRPADEIIIVIDGPIGQDLQQVIATFTRQVPVATVLSRGKNEGAGIASNAGLAQVSSMWLARLDADDIAYPARLEKQLRYLAAHPDIDVLGTAMEEFTGDVNNVAGVRRLPETHADLARYIRINSPINNPSVMMRTAAVRAVGGYRNVPKMEDYDLYARLMAAGYRFHNLYEPLTYFRLDPAVFTRRTGTDVLRSEVSMQRTLAQLGLVSWPRAIANLIARTGYRLLPKRPLQRIYSRLFHR
ncbi:glycosyltransferase [Corynebacterium choanae]|uniref:UDP-Gal:alpha-D-GlcNAc-diphosphoundecaprenol beta-1,3-galactosyltransferase n=1 Tax=Corynebacterium choanae TaxID=1862358 RepID=A0A3G6JBQ0_9CORY|nr:glycosyltransferase [Corynebacterium choanae]AZA14528.1 UDP-Gal:alpha-D-GlcNAc-diphosphoundecaprenol beta-1,3-galactosyltransferase [Corynebacterium choanae]